MLFFIKFIHLFIPPSKGTRRESGKEIFLKNFSSLLFFKEKNEKGIFLIFLFFSILYPSKEKKREEKKFF
jgi:hypothetical protein